MSLVKPVTDYRDPIYTAREIIEEMKREGFRLTVWKDSLLVEPFSKLTKEKKENLKKYKPWIMSLLIDSEKKPQAEVKSIEKPLIDSEKESQSEPRLVEDITLDKFANSDMALKVKSDVLNETIYFASNEGVAGRLKKEGFVVYTADELKVIAKKKPETNGLKVIHEIKQVFEGSKIIQ